MGYIRQATLNDIDGLLELWDEFTYYLQKKELDFFHRKENARVIYREMLKIFLKNHKCLVLVVVDKENLVGYHITSIRYPSEVFLQEPYGHISDLYLKSDYRGKGLGRKLLEHSRNWLREKGILRLDVKTFTDNQGGVDFWQRNGFNTYEVAFKCNLTSDC
ncbi:MAG: GNAT family N-acetyltransferase [Halanaerobiales bacterium]|nr:GNAT family N-acetyltransferase [Halanaerobiales bacterium]